jgi:hypothetical protein
MHFYSGSVNQKHLSGTIIISIWWCACCYLCYSVVMVTFWLFLGTHCYVPVYIICSVNEGMLYIFCLCWNVVVTCSVVLQGSWFWWPLNSECLRNWWTLQETGWCSGINLHHFPCAHSRLYSFWLEMPMLITLMSLTFTLNELFWLVWYEKVLVLKIAWPSCFYGRVLKNEWGPDWWSYDTVLPAY